MIRSLQTKLVLILMLFTVLVMIVVGTVLINSTTGFYVDSFKNQIDTALTQDFINAFNKTYDSGNVIELKALVDAYATTFGIDNTRDYYILDKDGNFVTGSNIELGRTLEMTPNLITALGGKSGVKMNENAKYMDYAAVLGEGESAKILYIYDTKATVREIIWMMFFIILQSLIIGIVMAIALSFVLSKAITAPIVNLTKSARKISSGDFTQKLEVYSKDEIGVLTNTFGSMATVLRDTLYQINSERNKLETIFLYLTDGVCAFERSGKLLHVNKTAKELLGLNEIQEGATLEQMFANFEGDIDWKQIGNLGRDNYLSYKGHLNKDQFNQVQLEVFFATFERHSDETNDTSEGIIAVIHDITEQERLEHSRREFVANVSHELRTPLTSIMGATETVLEDDDMLPQMRKKFLKLVISEAERMTRIVKDLLVLSRLDNNKVEWKLEPYSIKELAQRVFNTMQIDAGRREQIMTLDIKRGMPMITGDKERIEQVVINIVSNAIKYTADKGQIDIKVWTDDTNAYISVKDNGVGIPEKDIPRLFERFYRVDKARSREAGGTGLGLAIAMEIVQAHKGDIKVKSEFGKGTEMTIVWPINNQQVK